MGGTTANELSENLFAKAYHYQMSIQLLVRECESKDATLSSLMREISELRTREQSLEEDNARLKQAALFAQQLQFNAQVSEEHMKAVNLILDAVLKSLRPLGLHKKKFLRIAAEISRQVPNEGPQASRHIALLNATRKVLARGHK